jgi:hypothetical protein
MGKKPVLGLVGLFWAGIALTGCECCRNSQHQYRPNPAFGGPSLIRSGGQQTPSSGALATGANDTQGSTGGDMASTKGPGSAEASPSKVVSPAGAIEPGGFAREGASSTGTPPPSPPSPSVRESHRQADDLGSQRPASLEQPKSATGAGDGIRTPLMSLPPMPASHSSGGAPDLPPASGAPVPRLDDNLGSTPGLSLPPRPSQDSNPSSPSRIP